MMDAVREFLGAALPWIAMGLAIAIILAKNVNKKDKQCGDYGTEGMCLGMCFGVALMSKSGIGISLGMLLGLVIGSMIHKEQKKEEDGQG